MADHGGQSVPPAVPAGEDETAGPAGTMVVPPAGGRPVTSRSVAVGVRWMAASQAALQLTRLLSSVVLARLLAPRDFGLVALAAVVTTFLDRVLGDTGTGSALVQRRDVPAPLASSVFFFNVGVGLATWAAVVVSAPLLAALLGDARVRPVLQVLALGFVVSSFGQVPRALLRRSLSFRAVAMVNYANALVSSVVSIVLAAVGMGVWALVWGVLAGSVAATSLAWAKTPWQPRRHFRWSDIRSVSRFSANLSAFNFFNYFAAAGDKYVVGRFVGTAALGFYGMGYRLLIYPATALTQVFREVLFPAFSGIQDDRSSMGRGYVRGCAAVALVSFPMTTGVLLLADPLVRAVLGERWAPAIPILALMAPVAALQSIMATTGVLYQANGRTDLQLRWGIFAGAWMMASYLVGANWGADGVAAGFLVGMATLAYPAFAIPFRLVDLPVRRLLTGLAPILAATGLMAAAVLACRAALEHVGAGPDVVAMVGVAVGVVAYGAAVLVLKPAALGDLLLVVRADGGRLAGTRARPAGNGAVTDPVSP